tara:strand:+ start:130 stop:645 length:516 start_codon:yes stop_codon:yes gene_type:complete
MSGDLLDKIHIAYNAPYAVGNMLMPSYVPTCLSSATKISNAIRHPNFPKRQSDRTVADHRTSPFFQRRAWEPIMPKMVEAKQSCKLFRFLGVMGASQVATSIVGLSADKPTKAKLDIINGATAFGIAAGLGNMDLKEDFGGPAPEAFKYGNMVANVAMGAALIKRGMDNLK